MDVAEGVQSASEFLGELSEIGGVPAGQRKEGVDAGEDVLDPVVELVAQFLLMRDVTGQGVLATARSEGGIDRRGQFGGMDRPLLDDQL